MTAAAAPPLPLPRALTPWAALFGEMPEAHVRLVSTLVTRLAPLIDKAETEGARPRGEIDSFSGIGTRGDIERLLASEWLLRDLAPDEFLRRAAERELMTFEPVHRQAADSRAVLVVLDAGPAMLGRPRLVAFAALVCLANAARRRGAPLMWATNAAPERGWRQAFAREDVAALLDEVSATPLAPTALARIDQDARLLGAPRGKPRPSLWCVGPDGMLEAQAANRVAIVERPRLDERGFAVAAHVKVSSTAGRAAEATFDLPGEAEATALLREPFRTRPMARGAPPTKTVRRRFLPSGIAFTRKAEHLVAAVRQGLLIIPTAPAREEVAFHLPLARYERVLGLHVDKHGLTVALAIRHTTSARIIVRDWDFSTPEKPGSLRFEVKLPREHALVRDVFPRSVVPFLGFPENRRWCWVLTTNGSAAYVSAKGVHPLPNLAGGRVIGVTPDALLAFKPERVDEVSVAPNGVVVGRRHDTIHACSPVAGATVARFVPPDLPLADARALEFHKVQSVDWLAVQAADGAWVLDDAANRQIFRAAATGGSERILGFVPHPASKRPAALTLAGDDRLRLRDERWFSIGKPVAVPPWNSDFGISDVDHFRVATDGSMTYVAMAICDDDGFVEGLSYGPLEAISDLHYAPDMVEWATCLRS